MMLLQEPRRDAGPVKNTPFIHIVLGVHQPRMDYLQKQLQSVLQQSHEHFHVHLCPDGPQGDLPGLIRLCDSDRITLHAGRQRRGIYTNFMRGLALALNASRADDDLFAFCDQDDLWHTEKLARQARELIKADASMVYCDARVIDADGEPIAPSLFAAEKRLPHQSLTDLIIANDVSGNAMLFNRNTALAAIRYAPVLARPGQKAILHDWWVALAARALGPTCYVPAAYLDYRRHAANVIGPSPERAQRRPWGTGVLSPAFREKSALHFAVRHVLAQRLRNMLAEHGAKPPDKPIHTGFEDVKGHGFDLLVKSVTLSRQGDCHRSQSLYMSFLGKAALNLQFLRASGGPGGITLLDAHCHELLRVNLGLEADSAFQLFE